MNQPLKSENSIFSGQSTDSARSDLLTGRSSLTESGNRSSVFSWLMLFKRQRGSSLEGVTPISAAQFIEQHQLQNCPEVIVDLMFAQWLDERQQNLTRGLNQSSVGNSRVYRSEAESLCHAYPHLIDELTRQIEFHLTLDETQELEQEGSPNPDSLSEKSSGRDSDQDRLTKYGLQGIQIEGLELIRPIGRGGMGVVYLARQTRLNRQVAVKFLLGGALASENHRARFRAEAQLAASVRHPNIVQIHEVDESQDQPYIVMEYVDGGSLDKFLNQHRPSTNQTVKFIKILAAAIHEAHRVGVVHRDLKPANILLSQIKHDAKSPTNSDDLQDLSNFVPKIADFGLAKLLEVSQNQDGPALTLAGDLVGTPSYMAPEQANGGSVGARTDQYALGAIMYQMLSGQPPFLEGSAWDTLQRVVQDSPPKLPRSIPRDLQTICEKCLSKEPQNRYSSMFELEMDLDNFLCQRPISARPLNFIQRSYRWCQRNRTVSSLAGLIFMALVALLVTLSWSRSRLIDMLAATEQAKRNEVKSLQRSRESLVDAKLSEARAWQSTRQIGQRLHSLESIRLAQELFPEVNATPQRAAQLRDLALAAAPLIDVEFEKSWSRGLWLHQVFSADRKFNRLARIKPQGNIEITEGFGERFVCELPRQDATQLTFSSDGEWLAVAGSSCRLYRFGDWSHPLEVTDQSQGWWIFTPDNKHLIGFDNGGMLVFDLHQKKTVQRFETAIIPTVPIAVSPDCRRLALANQNHLQIIDFSSGKKTAELRTPDGSLMGNNSLVWHPNSRWLAAAKYSDDQIWMWDIVEQKPIRKFPVSGNVFDLAFDPQGKYLISCGLWGGEREVFDIASEASILRLPPNCGGAVGLSDEGDVLILNYMDQKGKIFRVSWQTAVQSLHTQFAIDNSRFQLATSPDHRWLAVHTQLGLELYDLMANRAVAALPIGILAFDAIEFDNQNRLWGILPDGVVCWLLSEKKLSAPKFHKTPRGFVPNNVSPDGRWAALANWIEVKLVNLETPDRIVDLGPISDVRNVVFSPDSKRVAACSWNEGHGVRVWQLNCDQVEMKESVKLIASLEVGIHCQAKFSPDGKWLFTSPRGGEIWNTETWERVYQLNSPDNSGSGFGFDFAPDSRWCVHTHGTGALRIVDLTTGEWLATLTDPDHDRYFCLLVARDQRSILGTTMGRRGAVKRWNLDELQRQMDEWKFELADFSPKSADESEIDRLKVANSSATTHSDFIVESNEHYEKLVVKELAKHLAIDRSHRDWKKSLERLEAALAHIPGSALINNNLAWFLATAPVEYRDLPRSIELARKSLEIEENTSTWNTLGTALCRHGEYEPAIEAINKSLGDGTHVFAAYDYFVLAICHAELGNVELAEKNQQLGIDSLKKHRANFSPNEISEIESFQQEAEQALARRRK